MNGLLECLVYVRNLTDGAKKLDVDAGRANPGQLLRGLEAAPLGRQPLVARRLPRLGRLSTIAIAITIAITIATSTVGGDQFEVDERGLRVGGLVFGVDSFVVWFGLVWLTGSSVGLVWFGKIRLGSIWFGLVRLCLVWFGSLWFGLVWVGWVWLGCHVSTVAIARCQRYRQPPVCSPTEADEVGGVSLLCFDLLCFALICFALL